MPTRDFENEVIDRLARMEQQQVETGKDVVQIKYRLEGNGSPGLIVEVDRLKQAERRRSGRKSRQWALILLVLGTILTMGATVISDHIELARRVSAATTKP